MALKIFLVISVFCGSAWGQTFEDKRCRCMCPNPAAVLKNAQKSDRRLYIAYVTPNQCNCVGVILPRVTDYVKEQSQIFCPHCECKYESRNTTVIRVVVLLVLWVLIVLSVYLFFVILLEPLRKKKHTRFYEECNTEETARLLRAGEANTGM